MWRYIVTAAAGQVCVPGQKLGAKIPKFIGRKNCFCLKTKNDGAPTHNTALLELPVHKITRFLPANSASGLTEPHVKCSNLKTTANMLGNCAVYLRRSSTLTALHTFWFLQDLSIHSSIPHVVSVYALQNSRRACTASCKLTGWHAHVPDSQLA